VPPAVDPSIYSDKNARFELRPDFRRVLTALPTFKADQTLFAWEEVVELLKQYILSNQSFFDRRNILVALVKDDPLGQAFQVDAFHRTQTLSLLRKQLIYVPGATSAAPSQGGDMQGKRPCPDDEQPAKQLRMSDDTTSEEEEDEIGFNSHAIDSTEDEEEMDWDTDEIVYEYDTYSTDEAAEERPIQAGGGMDDSSDEDSDPECLTEPVIQIAEADSETENWADCEDNTIEERVAQTMDCSQYCLGCKKLSNGRFCQSCWQARKDWLPDRPKLPFKSRRQRDTLREKQTVSPNHDMMDGNLCTICCAGPKNASLIHGQLGHLGFCYPCAKKIWKKQGRCPVCRRKVEKIVKIIEA